MQAQTQLSADDRGNRLRFEWLMVRTGPRSRKLFLDGLDRLIESDAMQGSMTAPTATVGSAKSYDLTPCE